MYPCRDCASEMLYSSGSNCSFCSIDLAGSENPCLSCRDNHHYVDSVVSIGPWKGKLKEWVSIYKYGHDKRLGWWLRDQIISIINSEFPGYPVLPVPARKKKLRAGMFDPVGFMVSLLAKNGLDVEYLLLRKGNKTQKSLNREERLKGSALKFVLKKNTDVKGRSFVLVDDITTTGSTLDYCAALLKEYGAQKVYAVVFCKD